MSSPPPAPEELFWRQYSLYTDLYKLYITSVIQGSTFVCAITGGMISYSFVHANINVLRWALVLPTAINLGVTFLYLGGLRPLGIQNQQTETIAKKLDLEGFPSYFVLKTLLLLFGALHLLTVLGLVLLLAIGIPNGAR
jgi:hypothetical protein